METADLTAWLAAAAPDFALGAALYAALGSSRAYQRLFALPPTAYSRQLLARELRALGEGPPLVPTPPAASRPETAVLPRPVPTPAAPLVPTPDPALLSQVRRQLKATRDERSQLHAQLTAPRLRKTDRHQLAERILALTEQEQRLLTHQAHVQQHGRLPGPVPAAEVSDTGELRRRLGNLLSRRAKLRKLPARAADLAGVEADITLIRQKLSPTTS